MELASDGRMEPCVLFLDSLEGQHDSNKVHAYLKAFVEQEWLAKAKAEEKADTALQTPHHGGSAGGSGAGRSGGDDGGRVRAELPLVVAEGVPQQDNCHDCGVYMVRFARELYQLNLDQLQTPDDDEVSCNFRLVEEQIQR